MADTWARYGPTLLTAANTSQTVITTGGTGTYVIVRDITIVNETGNFVAVTYGIGTTNTDAAGKRLAKTFQLAASDIPYTWGGFLPLFGGASPDLFYAMCDTASGATITIGAIAGP